MILFYVFLRKSEKLTSGRKGRKGAPNESVGKGYWKLFRKNKSGTWGEGLVNREWRVPIELWNQELKFKHLSEIHLLEFHLLFSVQISFRISLSSVATFILIKVLHRLSYDCSRNEIMKFIRNRYTKSH